MFLMHAKDTRKHFPNLYQSDPAVEISTYDPKKERKRKIAHLHNSPETEISNSKLFLFGTSEDSIDSVGFMDSKTGHGDIIQASGRAMRYVEGKTATIMVPVMLPYYGQDLEGHASQIDKEQIRDAFRYLVDVLDSLADMDPVLRDQVYSGQGGSNGNPGIIEFDFPTGLLPEIQGVIEAEAWRVINPETDSAARGKEWIRVTEEMRAEIIRRIEICGSPAALMRAIHLHEAKHQKPDTGLTSGIIHHIVKQGQASVDQKQWERLSEPNEFLSAVKLPTKESDWLSCVEMEQQYVGDETRHKRLLQSYMQEKRQGLINQGRTSEEASSIVNRQFAGRRPIARTSALCASPATIAELINSRQLRPRSETAPKKEPDWLSGSDLKEHYIGRTEAHNEALESYAHIKRQELIATGCGLQDAARAVDEQFAGMRSTANGREAMCASPAAVAELAGNGQLRLKADKPPLKESDWLSPNDMAENYVGTLDGHERLLTTYAGDKFQELIQQRDLEEAAVVVAEQYVGMRSSWSHEVLCGSSSVVNELLVQGKLRLKSDKAPAREDGWLSGWDMASAYVGGNVTHTRLLRAYAEEKRQELIEQDNSPEDAAAIVDDQYAGMRDTGTSETFCGSSIALDELVKRKRLRPKSDKAPPKNNWFSPADMMENYIGGTDAFETLFQAHAERKQEELANQECSIEEAVDIVEERYVGLRWSAGREPLCASPETITELLQNKLLRLRTEVAPDKEEDWYSGADVSRYFIGEAKAHKRRLEKYAENKKQEFISRGENPRTAATLVDKEFAGLRYSAGQETTCVSLAAVREMVQSKELRLKPGITSFQKPKKPKKRRNRKQLVEAIS